MQVAGQPHRTIWVDDDGWSIGIIDQTLLPHAFETVLLQSVEQAATAISDMLVRGAPLIGATAAYGLCLAMREDPSDTNLQAASDQLMATRPTAVNLRWALDEMGQVLSPLAPADRAVAAYAKAANICDDDVEICRQIGEHGLELIKALAQNKPAGQPVNILTHCNAGWLATVDWGTATAPIYMAFEAGIDVHVWVDETRPRNQGAALTSWELGNHGVPHTLITDNAGGHLMQHGLVDMCIVGTDRTTYTGDVCNKIGTYLKALAAHDNNVPFYVALPSTTIDWTASDGLRDIPIEQRHGDEIGKVAGRTKDGEIVSVAISPDQTPIRNDAFDVTPARLVTGLVTERGIAQPNADSLRAMFPDLAG
ncbi:MAG: S-methyl-5-thioribose-1-phosphate isomerase [Alphaproteobacteria bacterium]|nr:MAG: S-methyl-5-thioribose-1-phosphate isomerase [Alphaproteobacteria bacterium]